MSFKLIDTQDRNVLQEGRIYGFGSGFATFDGETVTMQYPVSSCRDYLNDVCYSQVTGKPYSKYGIKATKIDGLFNEEKQECYLVFGILFYKGTQSKYTNYDQDYAALEKNWQSLEKLINWFEEKFNVSGRSKFHKLADNRYLSITPLFWGKASYRISLHGLLLRAGIHYTGGDVMEYFEKFNIDGRDVYQIKQALPKIKQMISGVIPEQDMNKTTNIHGTGICNFEFP